VRRPEEISILNVLPGQVTAIEAENGPVVDVRIAVGGALLTARITRHSLRELRVHVGQDVHALVKAVSFDRRSVGYS
jgi:molybdate transport system ATP-binding protein